MTFWRKFAWLFRRHRKENDLRDELAFHLSEEAAERGAGAARRELGNLALIQEDTRSTWSWLWLEQLFQDLRYAARTMLQNKMFTALAALSLALGIGANTAIYSFLDALLLRSLPVPDAGSLAILNWHIPAVDGTRGTVVHNASGSFHQEPGAGTVTGIFPYPAFELLRASTPRIFSSLFAHHPSERLTLLVRNQADSLRGAYVSGNYFDGLELTPAAGRLISDADDRAGAAPVVVFSYAYAQKRFGNATAAAGESVLINNVAFTAIGVAPEGFSGVDPARSPDFFLPLHADLSLGSERHSWGHPPAYGDNHYYWIEIMGRLQPGVTRAQALSAVAPRFESWVAATAASGEERSHLPQLMLKEGRGGVDNLRRNASPQFFLLLGIVGLILTIACANIASLLLARGAARKREMAVRLSIGAGRWRVVRQLLTESVWLSALGGTLGILLAVWGIQTMQTIFGGSVALQAGLNWRVLIAAAALTLLTGVLFGLAPALHATRVDVIPALKETRAGEGGRHPGSRFNLGQLLVVSQISLSLLLIVVAGLFVRTMSNLNSLELGFHRDKVLLFNLNAQQAGHRAPEILGFYRDLARRFAGIPGVTGAAIANSPLIGAGAYGWAVVPLGQPQPEAPTGHGSGFDRTATRILETSAGFFSIMRIPLLAGREFDEHDSLGSTPVAIVNEAWGRLHFPNQNPVGRHLTSFGLDGKPLALEIVGLAKNMRYDDLTGDWPAIVYLPIAQNHGAPPAEMTFFLRTSGDPLLAARAVREIVQQTDARIPVTNLSTQTAQIDAEIGDQILFARLCSGFALLALAIACVGLYGTMSYSVARRTGEIGIRMALGAPRMQVVWMVMRQVIVMAAVGLAIGLPAAFASSRVMQSLLYGIKTQDLMQVGAAVAVVVAVVLAAGYAPAHRASRIDPTIALRHE